MSVNTANANSIHKLESAAIAQSVDVITATAADTQGLFIEVLLSCQESL
jgi:hypothetical protein